MENTVLAEVFLTHDKETQKVGIAFAFTHGIQSVIQGAYRGGAKKENVEGLIKDLAESFGSFKTQVLDTLEKGGFDKLLEPMDDQGDVTAQNPTVN